MKKPRVLCAIVCCVGILLLCGMCVLLYHFSTNCPILPKQEASAETSGGVAGEAVYMTYSLYAEDFEAEFKIKDGELFGRGKNNLGLFGSNTSDVYEEWVRIADNKDIIHVEAKGGTIIFLTETGCVYAMGNPEGIYYDSYLDMPEPDIRSPRLVMEDCAYASLGVRFILLLKSDHTLWFLGESRNGQSTKIENRVSAPTQIARNVFAIKAFGYTSAWIDGSYSLYMCGDNSYGQIGNGHQGTGFPTYYEDIVSEPYLVLNNCINITTSDHEYIFAKTQDGSTYAWGGEYGNVPQKIT